MYVIAFHSLYWRYIKVVFLVFFLNCFAATDLTCNMFASFSAVMKYLTFSPVRLSVGSALAREPQNLVYLTQYSTERRIFPFPMVIFLRLRVSSKFYQWTRKSVQFFSIIISTAFKAPYREVFFITAFFVEAAMLTTVGVQKLPYLLHLRFLVITYATNITSIITHIFQWFCF